MKVSANGIQFITRWEGTRLIVYLDAIGKPTVGVGHLVLPQDNLRVGDRITPAQSANFLIKDVVATENAVHKLVNVSLTQNQFDALCSFVFNLGEGSLEKSTLLKYLNQGNTIAAANEFKRWNRADGEVLEGLTRRRAAETNLFLS